MFKTVSYQVKQERLEHCRTCDSFNKVLKTCKKCGCYVPAKATFAEASCPDNIWIKSTPNNDIVGLIEESILKMWN